MDMDYYKDVSCLITGGKCHVDGNCEECETGEETYKKEQEKAELKIIEDITTFWVEWNFHGVVVERNRSNTMAKMDVETYTELKKNNVECVSTTHHEYDNMIIIKYPSFPVLKKALNLGEPTQILCDHDQLAVFVYDDCVYLCAPMIESS